MNVRSQKQVVGQLLRDFGAVCSTTLLERHIPRGGARVWELRHEGWMILTRPCSRPWHRHVTRQIEYVLVETPAPPAPKEPPVRLPTPVEEDEGDDQAALFG